MSPDGEPPGEPPAPDEPGAPFMQPDDGPHERAESHFCDVAGSEVYAPKHECPYCSSESEADEAVEPVTWNRGQAYDDFRQAMQQIEDMADGQRSLFDERSIEEGVLEQIGDLANQMKRRVDPDDLQVPGDDQDDNE